MKKQLPLFLFISCILGIVGFVMFSGDKSKASVQKVDYDYLGNIEKVHSKIYEYAKDKNFDTPSNSLTIEEIIAFDSDSNIVKIETKFDNGKIVINYRYNDKNQMISKETILDDDRLSNVVYSWKDGKVVTETDGDQFIRHEYHDNAQLSRVYMVSDSLIPTKLDGSGRIDFNSAEQPISTRYGCNDIDKNSMEGIFACDDFTTAIYYEYNDKSLLKKETLISKPDPDSNFEIEFEYLSYDDQSNWIERVGSIKGSDKRRHEFREIQYR